MDTLTVPNGSSFAGCSNDEPRKTRSASLPASYTLRDEVDQIISYVEEALKDDSTATNQSSFCGETTDLQIPVVNDLRTSSSHSDYGTLPTPLSSRHINIKTQSSAYDSGIEGSERMQSRPSTSRTNFGDGERTQSRPETSDQSTNEMHEQEQTSDKITINIGGQKFTTYRSTLQNIPNTRLARLSEQDMSYDRASNEFFFDRNPRCFESILDFYRTGNLHFMHCLCGPSIKQELDFWQLDEVLA